MADYITQLAARSSLLILAAVLGAATLAFAVGHLRQALHAAGSRPAGFRLATAVTVTTLALLAVGLASEARLVRGIGLIGGMVGLVALLSPSLFLRLTGGPREEPEQAEIERLVEQVRSGTAAEDDAAVELALDELDRLRSARISPYIDARLRAIVASSPGAPVAWSAWDDALSATAAARALRPVPRRSLTTIVAAALIGGLVAVTPTAIALPRVGACTDVADILARTPLNAVPGAYDPSSVASLGELLLRRPGIDFTRQGEVALDLEATVARRVNPEASRAELQRLGFRRAYERWWTLEADTSSRIVVHVEMLVQEFPTPEAATEFNAFANLYACQFANEAYEAPRTRLGLEIRYADDDLPIGDQISWIDGPRRYVIALRHRQASPDHNLIIGIASLAP